MDWEPADIVAALHKAGWSLRRLSFASGYDSNALKHALRRPYPKAERIIAEAIGQRPETLWPSRYGSNAQDSVSDAREDSRSLSPWVQGEDITPGE
ncbi:helix-turn-helix domain-containing protein [Thiohalorhabdus sp. Cl-TMA]|uniref:Transcriptional regulator n=1 Tax=Thiohalorhabdus methylotrophus TaxID=3242694 RepID=A0ABV4TY14_9GAMM